MPFAASAEAIRIGFLWTSDITPQYRQAFDRGLRELGYVEGRNIAVQHRSAGNSVERLDPLAKELIALPVRLVVTQGTPAAQAAARASARTPVVIALGEPNGTTLIDSLARPGRNVTGLTVLAELDGKRLELLKEMRPKAARVSVMFDARVAPWTSARQSSVEAVGRSLGMSLQFVPLRQPEDLASAFRAAAQSGVEGLLLTPSPLLSFHNEILVQLAAKYRLPAIYGNPQAVELGGLMSYGPSYTALFHRAAFYVDRILKGANPAELPIEQPSNFELAINQRTARALGIEIPRALLLRAGQVVD
jgi:putative ABC transport system substrate-binding protein